MMESQSYWRMAAFFGLLALFLLLERLFPRRATDMHRGLRWPANLGLVLIDTALLSALPVAAMGSAIWAAQHGLGVMNHAPLPGVAKIAIAWILLDLAIYWQHRWMHEYAPLWRLHRVHHTDIEFDTTTAVRFHPIEILLSMLYKCAVVVVLGAPPVAVLLLEITLNGFALFSHTNLRMPVGFERGLRKIFVTPEMHRVHHSVYRAETDSNYGSALSLWDRLFRSYNDQPRDGHTGMTIGLNELREPEAQRLDKLLLQPLKPAIRSPK